MKYTLEGNLGQLEVRRNFGGSKYSVSLNGQMLGEFNGKEARRGKDFLLPDGSTLTVKLVYSFMSFETRVLRNGQPVKGSASDPKVVIKAASGIAYFIGGADIVLYLGIKLFWPQLFSGYNINTTGLIIEGALFVILGYFIKKHQAWAAWAAAIFLTLDTILMFLSLAQSNLGTGWILIKILFIVMLFRGAIAFRKIKRPTTKDNIILGIIVILAVGYGAFALPRVWSSTHFAQIPVVQQILNSSSTTTTPNFISVSSSTLPSLLASSSYTDAKAGFIIQPPAGWVIRVSTSTGPNVEFDGSQSNGFAAEIVSGGSRVEDYTLQQFAAGVMEGFAKDTSINANVQILSQETTVLDGQPAYIVNLTFNALVGGQSYPMDATQISSIGSDGVGYNIFLESQQPLWSQYEDLLLTSASTFQFPKN